MTDLESFPIIYAASVAASVEFYRLIGYEVHYQFPPDGEPEYVGLTRGASNLGITAKSAGSGLRFELFTYVDNVDETLAELRAAGVPLVRAAENMPWGERTAYVADPDGNPVVLAQPIAD